MHRSRRVRIYSFCFIDSVVPQNIHESCSNWLYNLWKKLYRHPYLPSPIKKFVLRNSLKIFGTTRSWDWERFRDQSFSIAGEEGWGILVESHSFKAKLRSVSLHKQCTKRGGLQKIGYHLAANQWAVYKNPIELYALRGIRWILSWLKLYHHLSPLREKWWSVPYETYVLFFL